MDRSARELDEQLLQRIPGPGARPWATLSASASSAARGGLVWWTVSALSLIRGRRGRRLAGHGIAGWLLGHTTADLIKASVDRRRPARSADGSDQPHTSSMPSTHAAGAFGYAVAAGLEEPDLAAPLLVLAGLVSVGRLVRRRHFPTDVMVGVVLGAVVGAAAHHAARRVFDRRSALRGPPVRSTHTG